MDEIEELPKEISEIFEGTWELIITNPEGKKKSDEVMIYKSGKYYKGGKYVYDFQAKFVGKNILIHKCEISNKTNYFIEVIDNISENYRLLSGKDEKQNEIEYVKHSN